MREVAVAAGSAQREQGAEPGGRGGDGEEHDPVQGVQVQQRHPRQGRGEGELAAARAAARHDQAQEQASQVQGPLHHRLSAQQETQEQPPLTLIHTTISSHPYNIHESAVGAPELRGEEAPEGEDGPAAAAGDREGHRGGQHPRA